MAGALEAFNHDGIEAALKLETFDLDLEYRSPPARRWVSAVPPTS